MSAFALTASLCWAPVQENPGLGVPHAHAGILAAAKAVWADLEEHGILAALLGDAEDLDADAPVDSSGLGAGAAPGGGSGGGISGGGGGGRFAGDKHSMELGASRSPMAGAPPGGVPLSEVRIERLNFLTAVLM